MDRRSSLRLLLPIALLLLFTATLLPVLSLVHAEPAAATYMNGKLSVSIPYQSDRAGTGHLVVEILDPEDHVLGRVERNLAIGKGNGSWHEVIAPDKPIAFADIVWQRLRYSFEYAKDRLPAIQGIEAISQVLRRPVVHILGQTEYLAGSRAAIRVIVSDASDNDIAETGNIRIDLIIPNQAPRQLFTGKLGRRGTVEAQFRFPSGLTGKYDLRYVADTPIGSTEYTQPIELNDKATILLTTEKPIYQPGQTIHVRALALDRSDMKAEDSRKLTFELEDSRGNKVFKKVTETDSFGIASAEFSLADEVNLGTYHLRAVLNDPPEENNAPSNNVEIALNVERYILPKFKVAVEFNEVNGKPKRDYRPGDHVTGTVRANYFFGKPVDHAEIKLKASSMDVAVFEAASDTGKTDADGAFKFDLKLPSYFAGKPLNQGAARALVEASVKDSAEQTETRGEPITISESPLLITAVPEGGTLIPHIENQVFILSAYPDGTPAKATLTVHVPQDSGSRTQQVTTDSGGVAVVRFTPGSNFEPLHIDADDHHGARTTSDVALDMRQGDDQVLLRTDQAVFKSGDPIHLKILSTRLRGTAYVDIVKNGQTILTRDIDVENGQADLTVNATPDLVGTLDIDAYLFGRDAQPVADHRLVFVQPADELKIETTADAATYKPGSDARIHFHVTNSHGEGVSAALGIQVVDEAVFALAEKQPGFAKVFFYLEQEAMKPRFEIHSLSMPDVITPVLGRENSSEDGRNLAARALFSATELAIPTRLDTEFGRALPQDKYGEYSQRYHEAFTGQMTQLAADLSRNLEQRPSGSDLATVFRSMTEPRDAWGTPVRLEPVRWRIHRQGVDYNTVYIVRSAGPDRQFDSADDLTVYLEEHAGNVVPTPGNSLRRGGTIDLNFEHDRGAFNGRAEVIGSVIDTSGAIIPGAAVTLHQLSKRDTRTARADASGRFTLSGLDPGRYEIQITSQGFDVAERQFLLHARDHAVLSASLMVGNVTQTVTVNAAPPRVRVSAASAHGSVGSIGGPMAGAFAVKAAPQMEFAQNFVINADAASVALPVQGRSFEAKRKEVEPAAPHIRSYFPEALYINPEILTDGHGDASVSIPIADSITTWRMAMIASTKNGSLGTGTSSIKVFQDFFVDLDLPVTLTQGDQVSIPVAIYNYSGKPGKVSLKLTPDAWFSLNNDTAEKLLEVESGRVGASQFTINANRIGKFKLTLSAHMDGVEGRDDILVREIEVIPNGREQDWVFNGRLDKTVEHELPLPPNAIPDATSVLVRLYPGPLSRVIEGMDSILSMPGGCFEQTSSSTYPNVLALDYMKRIKKLTPEVHAKAESYIANGYQRLLTFEVPGGGFSWFGRAPANQILTAYGLMEFNDMAKVSDVDPKLISRTADWLARQQQPDGSWKPDSNFINEGATNRYNSDVLRITAYIAWSLANTGYRGPAVEKAKQYIEAHPVEQHPRGTQDEAARAPARPDAYTLAVIANFAADFEASHPDAKEFTRRAMQALLDARFDSGGESFWTTEESGFRSTGPSAAIETTGMAVQALLKWGEAPEVVTKALAYLSSRKQASGSWGTTQATIMALRALLLASQASASDVRGTVEITLNGKPVETLKLTPENNDLLHQFVFKTPAGEHGDVKSGEIDGSSSLGASRLPANDVRLKFEGTGSLTYQVVGRSFVPYEEKPVHEALSINVEYDRTKLTQNDIATAKVTIHNNLDKTANMVMVDLGIPPGFDLLSEDLQSLQEKSQADQPGHLEKFSLTATQAILYFNALGPEQTVTLNVRLRAKYPIRARTFESRVYEYYSPEVSATVKPIQLEVSAK